MRTAKTDSGFTLIELLVVIAIIALLVSILLPALASARETARMAKCQAQLQQMGRAYANYASDSRNTIASFWWGYEEAQAILGGEFMDPGGDYPVAQWQVLYLIREQTGRDDLEINTALNPYQNMTQLVLAEYLADGVPSRSAVCPSDRNRLQWIKDPGAGYMSLANRMVDARFAPEFGPYMGSYESVPANSHPYVIARSGLQTQLNPYHQNATHHRLYNISVRDKYTDRYQPGRRRLDAVSFASMKVAMYDSHQRHFGDRELFFAYDESKQPLLFWDGSVRVNVTGDCNAGFRPNAPRVDTHTVIKYTPELSWEAPTRSGAASDNGLKGYYRWTRGGLAGVDYGGNEVNARTASR